MSDAQYEKAPDKEKIKGKVYLVSGNLFVYVTDSKLSIEKNLDVIFENIRFLLKDRESIDFVVKLEVLTSPEEKQGVIEITESLKKATQTALKLHESELVPTGVDGDGKTVFKRRGE